MGYNYKLNLNGKSFSLFEDYDKSDKLNLESINYFCKVIKESSNILLPENEHDINIFITYMNYFLKRDQNNVVSQLINLEDEVPKYPELISYYLNHPKSSETKLSPENFLKLKTAILKSKKSFLYETDILFDIFNASKICTKGNYNEIAEKILSNDTSETIKQKAIAKSTIIRKKSKESKQ